MKYLIPTCLILFFNLYSCGSVSNKGDSENENMPEGIEDTISADSLIQIEVDPARIEIDIEKLLSKTSQEFELPILIDSTFIEKYAITGQDTKYNLTYNEAKYLSFEFPEGDLVASGQWNIETFIQLDSLKTNGGYEEYQENLDLGQARYSIGQVIGKININSQSVLLLWNLDYATYEACPWGAGTYVFGTVFTNGVGTNSCLLAESSGGGDPPSWGKTYVQTEISDSSMTTWRIDSRGEYGYDDEDDYLETQERTELTKVNSYGFKVTERGGEYNY